MTTRVRTVASIAFVVAVAIAGAVLAGCRGVVAESLPASPTASAPESPPESPPAGGGGADLLIVAIMAGDRNPAAGGSFALSVIVGNDGTAAAPATRVRFLRSADEEITTADSEVGTVELPPIAVAGRASGSVEVSVPATGGTYYYGACVEAVTGESDTGNNCSTAVAVVVAASGEPDQPAEPGSPGPASPEPGPPEPASSGADLTVAAPMPSDANPAAGASFTLSATVVNGGTGSSNATEVRFFRSTDATIMVADTQVAVANVPALAASGSVTASADVNAPAAGGTFHYGACVDAVPGEAETGNNCSPAVTVTVRAPPPGDPDLRIGSTEVGADCVSGCPFVYVNRAIAVRVDVQNAGGGVSSGTTLRLYVSTLQAVPAFNRTEALAVAVPQLVAPGNFRPNTRYLNAPGTGGTYYYRACVDAVTDESDTTNNCGDAVALQVHADAPNFAVGATTSDSTVSPGGTFSIKVLVINYGTLPSDTATLLRYYRSADDTISSADTELGTAVVPELGVGPVNARRYSLQVSAPGTPGTYYYGACVDAVADEPDTTNNCGDAVALQVHADAPDFAVGATTSDSTVSPGGTFSIEVVIANWGSIPSDTATLRYYRSVDDTINSGDTELGTDEVPELRRNIPSMHSLELTAPGTPAPTTTAPAWTRHQLKPSRRTTARSRPASPCNDDLHAFQRDLGEGRCRCGSIGLADSILRGLEPRSPGHPCRVAPGRFLVFRHHGHGPGPSPRDGGFFPERRCNPTGTSAKDGVAFMARLAADHDRGVLCRASVDMAWGWGIRRESA